MRAIVDTNVASVVFGEASFAQSSTSLLPKRLDARKINLVVSDSLIRELIQVHSFGMWWAARKWAGKFIELTSDELREVKLLGES